MAKTDPRTIDKKLQKALTEARKSVGLTQADVANRLRKPQSFVSKYETGERILSVGELIVVCDALGFKTAKVLEQIS